MSRDPDPGDRTQVDSPEGKTRIVGTRALKHNEFIYDFTDAETEYWEALQDDEKNDFYQFAIGLKLKHPWDDKAKKKDRVAPDTIAAWESADAAGRRRLIRLSRIWDDPRFRDYIYMLEPGEVEFMRTLPQSQKRGFFSAVAGKKLSAKGERLSAREIMDWWNQASDREKSRHAAVGNQYVLRYRLMAEERDAARPSEHGFVPSRGNQGSLPHPSKADVAKVAEDMTHMELLEREENSSAESQGQWLFEKTIYQTLHIKRLNYHRIVHRFVRLDDDDNIQRRIVVKVIGEETEHNIEVTMNDEFGVHRRLTKRACPYILDCYGYSFRRRNAPPHLGYGYLEFAPFGDLEECLKTKKGPEIQQIPEPFIWVVFRGLAEALYLMYTGRACEPDWPSWSDSKTFASTNDNLEKDADWPVYLNLDIKPLNIVFSHAQPHIPAYKTPKMIDFGLVYTKTALPSTNLINRGVGTQGYRPPEQRAKNPHTGEIEEWTPIFNLGLIILDLMEWIKKRHWDDPTIPLTHRHNYDGFYSSQLSNLVFQCLELSPRDRPTLWTILYESRRGLERWQKYKGTLTDKQMDELPELARFRFDKEKFAVGAKAPEKVALRGKKHVDAAHIAAMKAKAGMGGAQTGPVQAKTAGVDAVAKKGAAATVSGGPRGQSLRSARKAASENATSEAGPVPKEAAAGVTSIPKKAAADVGPVSKKGAASASPPPKKTTADVGVAPKKAAAGAGPVPKKAAASAVVVSKKMASGGGRVTKKTAAPQKAAVPKKAAALKKGAAPKKAAAPKKGAAGVKAGVKRKRRIVPSSTEEEDDEESDENDESDDDYEDDRPRKRGMGSLRRLGQVSGNRDVVPKKRSRKQERSRP